MARAQELPLRVGVSRCLLGERVRYDGGHKHDRFFTEALARYVEIVPVCPEVEVGMGTPREPIRLVELGGQIHLRGVRSETDHTSAMREYARQRVRELSELELCGYVLKSDSPSCGLQRVKVWQGASSSGTPTSRRGGAAGEGVRRGIGLFAEALIEGMPHLPVEEETRLAEPRLRENWVERLFAYHRLRSLWSRRWQIHDLVAFHRANKLALMAHSPGANRRLNELLEYARLLTRSELRSRYEEQFMAGLRTIATPARHARVLKHTAARMSASLASQDRDELANAIDNYQQGRTLLSVPLALLRHHAQQRHGLEEWSEQTYLNPHPQELMLRLYG
jgi:uncharacterized protein YbbK (DUF523 family)/uncharacterized protein YbgA (DUF1722 family)